MADTERPNTGSFNLEFVSAEYQPHDRSASNECQRLGSMLEVGPWLKDKHQRRDVICTLKFHSISNQHTSGPTSSSLSTGYSRVLIRLCQMSKTVICAVMFKFNVYKS